MRRALTRLDRAVLRLMRTRAHSPAAESTARALASSGQWGAIWALSALSAAAFDPARRGRWLRVAPAPPLAVVANYGLKRLARRRRPALAGLPPLARAPSVLSFPSAHATSSVAAARLIGRVAPEAAPTAAWLAAAMCLTRPYLGMHYPSDVLAGAALGYALGSLAPIDKESARRPPAQTGREAEDLGGNDWSGRE